MSNPSSVAVFWDVENCSPPTYLSGYHIVRSIRHSTEQFGPIKQFKGYLNLSEQPASPKTLNLRSELQSSGVSLIDCPHNGKKDVVDIMIIVDMMAYAMDNDPSATLVLISGDRDFAYALATLRMRQFKVVLISQSQPAAHVSLKAQASHCFDWNQDVLSRAMSFRPSSSTTQNSERVNLRSLIKLQQALDRHGVPEVSSNWRRSTQNSAPPPDTSQNSDLNVTSSCSPFDHRSTTLNVSNGSPQGSNRLLSPHDLSRRLPPSEEIGLITQDSWIVPLPDRAGDGPDISGKSTTSTGAQPAPSYHTAPSSLAGSTSPQTQIEDNISSIVVNEDDSRSLPDDFPSRSRDETKVEHALATSHNLGPSFTSVAPTVHSEMPTHQANPSGSPKEDFELLDPAVFQPMVDILKRLAAAGIMNPERSLVADKLNHYDFQRAGADRWASYAQLAVDAGIIELGVDGVGGSWVTLKQTGKKIPLHFKPLVEELLRLKKTGDFRPLRSSLAYTLINTLNNAIYKNSGFGRWTDYAVAAEQARVIILGGEGGKAWASLHPSVGDEIIYESTKPGTPTIAQKSNVSQCAIKFRPLIDTLKKLEADGQRRLERSKVAIALIGANKGIYHRAGVQSFKVYSQMAETEGVVQMGGVQGEAWISLSQRYR